jgi:Leucine-rich repeat (LRR) protein
LPNLIELGLANNTNLALLPSLDSLRALQTLNLSRCNFSNVPLLAEALQGNVKYGLKTLKHVPYELEAKDFFAGDAYI